MKVEFPVFLDGRTIMVSEEAETQQELFAFIANMQEVFGNLVCERNNKKSDNVKLQVRNVEDDLYYEMICLDKDPDLFRAKKSYGCHKKGGGLFPKLKDKENNWLPNSGWTKWNKDTQKEE